jgi:hypothetical protein
MLLLGSRQSLWLGNGLDIADDDLSPEDVYGDGERADGLTFAIDRNVLYEVLIAQRAGGGPG